MSQANRAIGRINENRTRHDEAQYYTRKASLHVRRVAKQQKRKAERRLAKALAVEVEEPRGVVVAADRL